MLQVDALRGAVAPLAPAYPWLVFGSGVLLAWRFHRLQPLVALLVLFSAERALVSMPGALTGPTDRTVSAAVSVLLPLDIAVLAWHSERSLRTSIGRWTIAFLVVQPLAVALARQPELVALLRALGGDAPRTTWGPAWETGRVALVAFGAGLALIGTRAARRPAVVHSALLWALLAGFLAVGARTPLAVSVYLATGGLVLVVALVETSHRLAYDDELTGLPGRRALEDALARLGGRYAVAMVDIDHFKRFNDAHGHDAGDQLLRMVGGTLHRVAGGGRAFRYGGEEFAVLFPGKPAEEALPHVDALRRAIQASGFTLRGGDRPRRKPKRIVASGSRRKLSVTVSAGVAESSGSGGDPREVIKAADQALYRAKRAGRNRVALAS